MFWQQSRTVLTALEENHHFSFAKDKAFIQLPYILEKNLKQEIADASTLALQFLLQLNCLLTSVALPQ